MESLPSKSFDGIEVRRIRIVDDDNVLRMILSGKPQHPGLFRGEIPIERTRPEAGLLFFTEEATECGGLIFTGKTRKNRIEAAGFFSMDAYEQDQVMWLSHGQRGKRRGYGFAVAEQPLSPLTELIERFKGYRKWIFYLSLLLIPRVRKRFKEAHPTRLLMGSRRGNDVGVFMHDSKGRPRMRMVVDGGSARLEVLNESGKVTHTLPPSEGTNGKV
jgi:hypothetical protein